MIIYIYNINVGAFVVVLLLIAKGHPADVPNKAGQTPMDLCGNKDGKIYKALQAKAESGHHHHHEQNPKKDHEHDPEAKKNCFASQVI